MGYNLMNDFKDEIPGYLNNDRIFQELRELQLQPGTASIPGNLIACYQKLVDMDLIDPREMALVNAWLEDIETVLPR